MGNLTLREEAVLASDADVSIKCLIHVIRGEQVILDSDLAVLYEVETKQLNRNASRNSQRFPKDFRFQLTRDEYEVLKCQIVTFSSSTPSNAMRPYTHISAGRSLN